MVADILKQRRAELRGVILSDTDASLLDGVCPAWLLDAWRSAPLTGARMYVDDRDDPTGIGVSMQWMNATELLSELNEASPGREAKREGFLPVGKCLEGSGDPYFLSGTGEDPPLVRIPHTAARGGALNRTAVETVAPSLSQFLRMAKFR